MTTVPVPSIVHLKLGHYVALLDEVNGLIPAYDPIGGTKLLRPEVVEEETSGRFLVSAGSWPAGWRQLSEQEMDSTLGRCWFGEYPDGPETDCDECGTCPPGLSSGSSGSKGGHAGQSGSEGRCPGSARRGASFRLQQR